MTVRVVAGAIVRGATVLAARRGPGMHLAGRWELPGGKVEAGEDDRAALARELHEELGVHVHVGQCLGESAFEPILLVAYVCTLRHGTPTAAEHDALRWCGPDELAALHWADADVPLLAPLARWLRSAVPG